MLSINIPVFNIDVKELALQLVNQSKELGVPVEIRIYDDGSVNGIKKKNRYVSELPGIVYKELKKNLGRAAIRNRMGFDSQHKYLLFIDADSRIVREDYLKKYIEHATPGCVFCGGTAYAPEKPEDKSKLLRWVYGSKREAINARERNRKKSFIITSNNFLSDREVFNLIHFRENIGPYGHEDTLLGYDLFAEGIHPYHIDNPVEHTGLEDSVTFLEKSKEALNNLHFISSKVLSNDKNFSRQINFLRKYNSLPWFIPPLMLSWLYNLLRSKLEKNLTGSSPRLFFFDLYKLLYYAKLKAS
jgi:glycosyltransferase involved in cell wall biosynthesis